MPDPPFVLFGVPHLSALVLIAVLGVSLARAATGVSPGIRRRVDRLLAAVLAAFVMASYARLARTGGFRVAISLPLHLCDLSIAACLAALLTRRSLLVEISYYWALTGAVGALVTPDLRAGFPAAPFFLFFGGHALLVLTVVWLAASGTPPRRGGALRAWLALNAYLVVMGPLDWINGWNYGYLCRKPAGASALDWLGPWPWYLVAVDAIAAVAFSLLTLPWYSTASHSRRRSDAS